MVRQAAELVERLLHQVDLQLKEMLVVHRLTGLELEAVAVVGLLDRLALWLQTVARAVMVALVPSQPSQAQALLMLAVVVAVEAPLHCHLREEAIVLVSVVLVPVMVVIRLLVTMGM